MTAEDRDARLTAYALGDPILTPAARQAVEAIIAGDPAARRAVEETRQLAGVLTDALKAEEAATKTESVVVIPAAAPTPPSCAAWTQHLVAASLVMFAVAGTTYVVWSKTKPDSAKRGIDLAGGTALEPPDSAIETFKPQLPAKGASGYGEVNFDGRSQPDDTKDDGGKDDRNKATVGDNSPDGDGKKLRMRTEGGAGVAGTSPGTGSGGGEPGPFNNGGFRPGTPAPPVPTGPGRIQGALPKKGDPRRDPSAGAIPGLPGGPVPTDPRESAAASKPAASPPLGEGDGKPSLEPRDKSNKGEEMPSTNDRYPALQENGFIKVDGLNALSTFGVDVDTASYAIVRKYLTMGQLPPANAVRLEEMVNYFPYRDKVPDGDDPFAVTVEMADCPWQPDHRLVRLGLKAKPIEVDKRPASNLVFLIDVSGSMDAPNRLPLVKASLKLLVNQLGEKDRVAMVVYAGAAGLVLDSTSAMKKETILNALDGLQAGGSTNGEGGIQQAYQVASANFIKGGTNRVILCTDGDWNVGTTGTEDLVKLIEQKRETGVFLSVFGFGMGNLRDEMMVKLAGKGNGNYGYIDALKEANKVFVEQISSTLVTVAKDVKIQIEFNPAAIKSYRLLGYEKRALAAEDFHNDKKDAGEMGAGHVVTALYELVPVGAPDPVGKVDGLRYQGDPAPKVAVKDDKAKEAFVLKLRHKKPDSDKSTLREIPVSNVTMGYEKTSEDFQFASAVASFAMLLRDSPHKGSSNYALVLELAEAAKKRDPGAHGDYRAEFIELVRKAKMLSGK